MNQYPPKRHVITVSPPVPIGLGFFTFLGFGFRLVLGGQDSGLGLDNYISPQKIHLTFTERDYVINFSGANFFLGHISTSDRGPEAI